MKKAQRSNVLEVALRDRREAVFTLEGHLLDQEDWAYTVKNEHPGHSYHISIQLEPFPPLYCR